MPTFNPRLNFPRLWRSLIGCALVLVFNNEVSFAATVWCIKSDLTCSAPPFSSCSGPNCTTICANPAGNGYSSWGSADVVDNCGSYTCTQAFTNSAANTVTPSAGANGSLSPSTPQSVAHNQSVVFTAIPNSGYAVANFTGTSCGGTVSGNTYTASNVVNDCIVAVTFTPGYTASTSVGAGGSLSPVSRAVAAGATTTFTVTPNAGYAVQSISGCNGGLTGSTYVTGSINANCTVTASFGYLVTATAGSGGTISASRVVTPGQATSLTVIPYNGYSISSVTGCDGSLSGNTYTTPAINGACAVTATFSGSAAGTITCDTEGETSDCGDYLNNCTGTDCWAFCANPAAYGMTMTNHYYAEVLASWFECSDTWAGTTSYTVTPTASSGGTISPNSPQSAAAGTTKSFTLTPSAGFAIYSVTGTCGGSLSGSDFTTSAVNANCTVVGNFVGSTADFYRIEPSQEMRIDAHGVCSKITNNNASALFVPVKSSTEWSQFRSNAANIIQTTCP